ncbi:RNA polymerase sigma factor [Paenibacillus ginsengarvi]|uniref:RNA polymerase sigma factor n=1 Tax=Paenibacillus ginsengarvi TaxID=400777 RepID=UPI0013152E11|nr:RNA polymerase sigma factor [Paenibacillus ginsengarvi]
MQLSRSDKQDSIQADEDVSQHELAERARSGDREAFGELVRRHRAQALGWAASLTHDASLAEDIVQDALIRAFLHMGTLLNTDRFVPWLKRIVRNQANLRLRRGGPYGKEQPFTHLEASSVSPDCWEEVDWRNIDSILLHLSKSVSERRREQDPSEVMVRKEIVDSIRVLLNCLSSRERAIFEAHFFRHLSIPEIADLLGMPKAGVYNFLSRSRKKVQKERIRIYFTDFAATITRRKLPARNVLATPFEL